MKVNIYKSESLKETIYHTKSNSNIDIFYMPKKGYKKQHAIFTINAGASSRIFKKPGEGFYSEFPMGIAHFLEHKMFESIDGDMFDKFAKLGIDANAYTTHEETSYLYTSTNNFYEGLKNLTLLVEKPYFTDESVDKEKGIIKQEIKMYEDDPYSVGYSNLINGLYVKHPIKEEVLGTQESVNNINVDDLLEFHNAFYISNSMVFFAIGDLDFEKVVDTINEYETERYPHRKDIEIKRVKEPEKINKKTNETYMNIQTPLCYMGFKDNNIPGTGKDRLKRELALDIVLECIFGSSSNFYSENYNAGLIDLSFSTNHIAGKDYGYSLIFGQTQEPKALIDKVKSLIKRPKAEIFLKEDFDRIKNKTIGQYIMAFNSIESIANMFTSYFFEDVNVLGIIDILEEINYKYALRVLHEVILVKNSSNSIVYPLEDKGC